ncbi:hypothetical protein CDV55_104337 [Aspergillus turcosus]|uniref:Uncharacterized protein n=1 Tax=Aspergillus turcosus TaxID=1245748 RepID=A0A229YLT1_9EURO|nr:hypothetical protein CDV55_104337 [Aspergillus turcosus]RLL94629.1 hypothetical protein CFD26_100873 [Aspergillus turcosus]
MGYAVHRGSEALALEAQYRALPPETTTSTALRDPQDSSTQFRAYTDVYAVRVPVKALLPKLKGQTKSKSTRIFRAEGSLIGRLAEGTFSPGETGDSPAGFASLAASGEPRTLLMVRWLWSAIVGGEQKWAAGFLACAG